MAAGKSSVAQALAERLPRSVHLRGDMFRRCIVNGRVEMSLDPSEEARAQLHLRHELAVLVAQRYAAAGFAVVLQDIIVGAELPAMVARITARPLHVVVLAPDAGEVARREAGRDKDGYRTMTPAAFDAAFRADTPRVGLWLDTTTLSIDQTVDEILAGRDASLVP